MRTLPPFQRLLDDHGRAVHRYLVAMVGPADADDCFQEASIAALRAYRDGAGVRNAKTWLMTIAHNKAIDTLRARGRRAVPVEEVPEQAATDNTSVEVDPIWARVGELPEKQRAAVFLRSAADLSYAEVAQALGCSQDAARRSVHEGLKRLREELTAA